MLEKVFGICDASKSPNMDFFGRFKDFLPRVNQALFTTAMEDDSMAAMIASCKDNVIEFGPAKLEKYQPRDNYRDLLELSIYISGWRSCFRYPGAIHRARWMTMAMYTPLRFGYFAASRNHPSLDHQDHGSPEIEVHHTSVGLRSGVP